MSGPSLYVKIPGEPWAQPRHRPTVQPGHSFEYIQQKVRAASKMRDVLALFRGQVYLPRESAFKQWKGYVARCLHDQRKHLVGANPLAAKGAPLEVYILATFELPKTYHRKRPQNRPPRSWCTSRSAGDWDNLGKPVCDVATGILWHDDSQVARGVVEKVTAAQGEPGSIEILARALEGEPATLFERRLEDARGLDAMDHQAAEQPSLLREESR